MLVQKMYYWLLRILIDIGTNRPKTCQLNIVTMTPNNIVTVINK